MSNEKLLKDILKKSSYTSRDYQSIIKDILGMFEGDNRITDSWDNLSEADPLYIMLHLMAAHLDIMNYQIDYRVTENYMSTAAERSSVVRIANSFGYKIPGYYPAVVSGYKAVNNHEETLTLKNLTQFWSDDRKQAFVYAGQDRNISQSGSPLTPRVTMHQGVLQEMGIDGNNIDTTTNTYIVSNSTVAMMSNAQANTEYKTSKLVDISDPYNLIEYKEVPNIYEYAGEDPYIYEINVDPQNLTYIRLAQAIDPIDKQFIFKYIITDGNATMSFPTKLKGHALDSNDENKEITLQADGNTKIKKGTNPLDVPRIREEFKKHIVNKRALITVEDYKNYVYDRLVGEYGEVLDVMAIDRQSGTSQPWANGSSEVDPNMISILIKPFNISDVVVESIQEDLDTKKIMPMYIYVSKAYTHEVNIKLPKPYILDPEANENIREAVKSLLINYVYLNKKLGDRLTGYELSKAIMDSQYSIYYPNGLTIMIKDEEDYVDSLVAHYNEYFVLNKDTSFEFF